MFYIEDNTVYTYYGKTRIYDGDNWFTYRNFFQGNCIHRKNPLPILPVKEALKLKTLLRKENLKWLGLIKEVYPKKKVLYYTEKYYRNHTHFLINYPEIIIRNAKGDKYKIYDLWVKFCIVRLKDFSFLQSGLLGLRTSFTKKEYSESFSHPHLEHYIGSFRGFCLGATDFGKATQTLTEDNFVFFLYQLEDYLSYETNLPTKNLVPFSSFTRFKESDIHYFDIRLQKYIAFKYTLTKKGFVSTVVNVLEEYLPDSCFVIENEEGKLVTLAQYKELYERDSTVDRIEARKEVKLTNSLKLPIKLIKDTFNNERTLNPVYIKQCEKNADKFLTKRLIHHFYGEDVKINDI